MDLEHALEIASEHARDLAVGVKDYPSSRTIVFLADIVKDIQKEIVELQWQVNNNKPGLYSANDILEKLRAAIARAEAQP